MSPDAQTPTPRPLCLPNDRTYLVRYRPGIAIPLDGGAADSCWAQADVETQFSFPWNEAVAPPTEFRALCDDRYLYFAFRTQDADIVVLDQLRDKGDVVFEDRIEMFFCRDDRMTEYYCLEIDPRGRIFDYSSSYYRQHDWSWSWPGVEARGTLREDGYDVQGRIPLASFEQLGFPRPAVGVKIRCGLYRAEFSHRHGDEADDGQPSIHTPGRQLGGPPPLENWISWIDPGTAEPDFHVPSSLGWLEIAS